MRLQFSIRRALNPALTVCVLLALLPAQAATFRVNSTSDAVDANPGDGRCRTSTGVCTLRAAIQEANANSNADTIEVPAGTYTITRAPLNENNITTGDLDIIRPLTITRVGSGLAIVDGGPPPVGSPPERTALDRLFEIHPTAGNVTLSGLTLREGWDAKEGGALYNASRGTVRLVEVTLIDNVAIGKGGAVHHNGFEGGSLILDRTAIIGNTALGEGGGIYVSSGNLTTIGTPSVNTTIVGNAARNGGGIYIAGLLTQAALRSRVELARTTLADNVASASGGGIANELQGDLVLTDVTVANNAAAADGGGVSSSAKTSVAITRASFSSNAAGGAGAGLSTHTEGAVLIDASVFSENGTGQGPPDAVLDAEGGGGALSVDGKGPVTVTGSTFSQNASGGEGGGIAIHSSGVVVIANTLVVSNSTAMRGGGILNSGTAVTFDRVAIYGNTALGDGGGIDNQSSGQFTILDSSITSNSAENGGGFANVADATMLISRSLFWGNEARGVGGGFLHQSDGATEMENCTISGNRAALIGGGLMLDGDADLHAVNVTISRNTAPLGAGIGTPNGIVNVPVISNPQAIFRNTIVAGNFGASDCYGAFTSEGGNIDGGTSCYLRSPRDLANVLPAMRELADNGGMTWTHALASNSVAINAGITPAPPTDQRGVVRPQGIGPDSGAYEFVGNIATPHTPPSSSTTLVADADTWIDQNSPTDLKGSDSTLKLQSKSPNQNIRALVRFPLPPLASGSAVKSATLRLYAGSAANGRTLQAIRVSGSWSENNATWASQPTTTGAAATSGSSLGNVNWNVTAQVQAMYSTGNKQGFLIRDASENGESFEQQFYSREKNENPPTLIIQFGPAGQ